jgi:hypothetical protein
MAGTSLELIPLIGIIPQLNTEPGRLSSFLFVSLPAVALLPAALFALIRQRNSPAAWWLLLHCIFTMLMPPDVYDHIMHAGRNAGGLVLSTLFLLPMFVKPVRLLILAYWLLPSLVWLIPVLSWAPWLSTI